MTTIPVVPNRAGRRAETLLERIGLHGEPARAPAGTGTRAPDDRDDAAAAIRLAHSGRATLYVPLRARVSATVGRVLILHGGTRAERSATDAGTDIAATTGASIVVVHVSASTGTRAAGLSPRLADHGPYDWAEWRTEFVRRFFPGVAPEALDLRVVPTLADVAWQVRDVRPDLVIAAAILDGSPELGVPDGTERNAGTAIASKLGETVVSLRVPLLLVPPVGQDEPSPTNR